MSSARPLVLCHFTMVDVEPPDFVDVAARVGFTGVSLMVAFPRSYGPGYPLLGDTPMRRATKQRLVDTGLTLVDASVCRLEPEAQDFRPIVESAAYLGARHVNVNGSDPDEGRLVDRFAALCALCAEHGLGAGLEFMMSTQVRTLAEALRVIDRSGAPNAAVTVDALHLARSGGSPADVAALDPARIAYVQLCDGPATVAPQGYSWEGATQRELPGDGELPLRALVGALAPDVLLGVEAPSQRRRDAGISPDAYAAQAMKSVQRVLAAPTSA